MKYRSDISEIPYLAIKSLWNEPGKIKRKHHRYWRAGRKNRQHNNAHHRLWCLVSRVGDDGDHNRAQHICLKTLRFACVRICDFMKAGMLATMRGSAAVAVKRIKMRPISSTQRLGKCCRRLCAARICVYILRHSLSEGSFYHHIALHVYIIRRDQLKPARTAPPMSWRAPYAMRVAGDANNCIRRGVKLAHSAAAGENEKRINNSMLLSGASEIIYIKRP